MKRLAILMVLASAACADNPGLVVLNNVTPGAGCVAGTGGTSLEFGLLDVTDSNGTNPGYWFTPAIQNAATANPTNANLGYLQLEGADIELVASNTVASEALITALGAQNKRTVRFSASIPPNSAAGIGYPIIDSDQTTILNQNVTTPVQVIARTDVFGTLNGNNVTSAKIDYPVNLCNGCLINDLGACPVKGTIRSGGACSPFQDPQTGVTPGSQVDCCDTSSGDLECPAVAASP